eukprot:4286629-Pyramimonas_sp.AAC.1
MLQLRALGFDRRTRHNELYVTRIVVSETNFRMSHNLQKNDSKFPHYPPGPGGSTGSRRLTVNQVTAGSEAS